MVYMRTIGERLKHARSAAKLSQEELGRAAGMTKQAISGIERGETKIPGADTVEAICAVLKITTNWLVTGKGEPQEPQKPKNYRIVSAEEHDGGIPIKFLEVRGSCGGGAINWEERDGDPLIKESSWFKRYKIRPKDAIAIWADGDSMADYIVDGDIVVFDTSKKTPKSGHIFLIQHPDGTKIKKLRLGIDGSWMLESNNLDKRRFPDERISPDQAELLVILGEFVYRQGG